MVDRNTRDDMFTERGSVLVGVLMLVLVLSILGAGLFEAGVIENRSVSFTEADARAFYAAESGLNRAALDVAWYTTTVAWDTPTVPKFCKLKGNSVPLSPSCPATGLLNANNTTPFLLYPSTCFGKTSCDSVNNPNSPAYYVEAVNHPDPDKFWLISTACIPGPAANPCPPGARTGAQVKALIKPGGVPGSTSETVTHSVGFPGPITSGDTNCPTLTPCIRITRLSSGDLATDSYNSRNCTPTPCNYGGTNIGNSGNIFANGNIDLAGQLHSSVIGSTDVASDPTDITISSGAHVYGSVMSGGAVNNGGTVDGGVTQNSSTAQITFPTLPNCTDSGTGSYSDLTGRITQYDTSSKGCSVASPCLVPNGPSTSKWSYGGQVGCTTCGIGSGQLIINTGNSGYLLLGPGKFCLGQVSIGGSTIKVSGTSPTGAPAPTILYVNGQFTSASGSQLNNLSKDPQNLQLVSTYGNDVTETLAGVTLNGGGDSYMTIYAPSTSVGIGGSQQIFGAVAANTVSMSGTSQIHYDTFLGSGSTDLLLDAGVSLTFTTPGTSTVTYPPGSFSLASWQQTACRLSGSSWVCL